MMYLGDFDTAAVITFPFTTHEADGGAIAPSSAFEAADIRIYRGSSATERASSSGITMTSPFDSVTGLHMLSIDTSDDDDVGFFDASYDYHVVLVPDETVDGQTVVKVLASFSIQNRFREVIVAQMGSGVITSSSFTSGAITAGAIATDAIGSDELAASAITEIQAGLATASALTTVGTNVDTVLTRLGTPSNLGGGATIAANLSDIEAQTDDIGAAGAGLTVLATAANLATVSTNVDTALTRIGTPSNLGSGASVAANLVDIEGQTDDIGAAGAGLTAVPWNAAWDAEVQSEANDALVANGLDHLVAASVTGTDVVDNSIIAKIVSKSATADWDSFVNTTDALEAQRDNVGTASNLGGGATIAANLSDIEAQTDDIGAAGAGLTVLATAANLATVSTNVDTALTRLGTPSNLGGGATIAANLSDIEGQTDDIGAAGAGLTAVPWNAAWDAEVQSEANDALVANGLDHLVAASVTGTDVVDNSIIAKIVSKSATADWDSFVNTTDALEAQRDNVGTASNLGGGATIAANLSDIEAQTDDIGAAGAGLTALASAINLSSVSANVALILADTGTDGVVISSSTMNSIADAIFKRDLSAVTGEAARSLLNAIRALRNKVAISGGTMTVYKEDDTTAAWTAAVTSDAGADPITAIDPA